MSNTKRIPEEIIDEIRHQADIVAVISEYVALTKTGKNYKGLCPFHKEKTPSFIVSPQKQIFHCYGCGVGGNVFTFLMQHEKYTFPEVVRVLAKRLGISLPTKTPEQSTQHLGRLDLLYKLHLETTQYFARQLIQSEQGKKTLEYLRNRGIGKPIIQKFSLGYASPAWDDLQRAFIQKYPVDVLLESGLLIKKKSGVGRYDRFRDRLMIPIHDDRGRIVAFGGRILGEGDPKYLNSPESPIFHKGRVLFGLHQAKDAVRRHGHILIVEGYFDMIVPYSVGVEYIAATMGTALTEHHLRLLQRYTKKVTLVFDPDPAGIRAVQRTLDLFLKSGFEVRAAILSKGEDPDTAVRRMGSEQFQHHINQAPLLLDFIRDRIIEQYDLSRIDHQIACANQILPTIVKIQDIVERNIQIGRTADILKIADKALLQEFKKVASTGKPQIAQPIPKKKTAIPSLERYLIKALVKDKSLIPHVKEEFDPRELSHPVAQKVVRELFIYSDKTDFEARILDTFHGTEYQASLANLFMDADEVVDPAKTVQDCLYRLRQKHFEHATLDSTRKLRDAQERKNDKKLLDTILEQKNKDLRKKRNFLKKSDFPLEK
jgi:DNA primase